MDVFEEILELKKNHVKAAVCTIVNTKGSTPRKVGSKMIVKENASILGTIGGGALEKSVINEALLVIKNNEPQLFRHDLLQHHNMCCGGSVEIYIEPVMEKCKLYIFGAGHTGIALAELMTNLDFEVYIIDDRASYINDVANTKINKLLKSASEILSALPFNESTFVCIMTYDHALDREILAYCIKKPTGYLGMIGSVRKVEITKKMFVEGKLCTLDEINTVDMPMGIDISADGPTEIAISIAAKLVQTRHMKNKTV